MSSTRQLDLSRRTYLLGPSSPFRFQCQYPVIKYGTRKKNTLVDDFTNKKLFSWGFPMFDDTGSSPCSVVVVSPHQLRSRHHDCKWRQKGTKFRSSLMALAQNFASTQWRLTGYHRWWRSQPATFFRQPASQPLLGDDLKLIFCWQM